MPQDKRLSMLASVCHCEERSDAAIQRTQQENPASPRHPA